MLRISVFLILYFAQGTLFAQSQTIFDSVGVHSNKVFLQFGYFEDNSLVENITYEKISGFKSTKLGLIKYYSDKSSWGYNLIHFKGQNS